MNHTPEQEAVVRSVGLKCKGRMSAEMKANAPAGTTLCGYDVNELILAQPLDGKERGASCPNCGVWITWSHCAAEAPNA